MTPHVFQQHLHQKAMSLYALTPSNISRVARRKASLSFHGGKFQLKYATKIPARWLVHKRAPEKWSRDSTHTARRDEITNPLAPSLSLLLSLFHPCSHRYPATSRVIPCWGYDGAVSNSELYLALPNTLPMIGALNRSHFAFKRFPVKRPSIYERLLPRFGWPLLIEGCGVPRSRLCAPCSVFNVPEGRQQQGRGKESGRGSIVDVACLGRKLNAFGGSVILLSLVELARVLEIYRFDH